MKKNQIFVGVYGTLKEGFGNHYLLENSKFIGYGITLIKGLLYDVGFPYFIPEKYIKDEILKKLVLPIQVEIYEVDKRTVNRLDRLEGYPDHYDRKQFSILVLKKVNIKKDNKVLVIKDRIIKSWVYYIKHIPHYAELLNKNKNYVTKIDFCEDKECIKYKKIKYVYWGFDNFFNTVKL